MRRIFITLVSIFMASLYVNAQSFYNETIKINDEESDDYRMKFSQVEKDSILFFGIPHHLKNIEFYINSKNRYKLYPTENMYTFLQLDTKTGKINQVHWSLDSDKEYTVVLNDVSLNLFDDGKFELVPTKNMYQFILIDTQGGVCYHVQWSFKASERGLRRIY